MSTLLSESVSRAVRLPFRFWFGASYFTPKLRKLVGWTFTSRETTNFTYDLTDVSLAYLAHTISVVMGCGFAEARRYIDEARTDERLHRHVLAATEASSFRDRADRRCAFGRRLGWYAFARILKPRVIVETGVDKGHGSVILCAALLRNAAEGYPGKYYGTDINPDAGWLLQSPYDAVGSVLCGDSIASLSRLNEQVDLFINDSDHSADYEFREYQVIAPKLSSNAIILGDNAHVTSKLAEFSRASGRHFLFFREVPKDHWYPGAGIGISFPAESSSTNMG